MDKTRDVRRGASRQNNKQSGHKLVSGFNGIGEEFFSEKSKKLRRISSVDGAASPSNGSEDRTMGCDSSDREIECPSPSQSIFSAKRFRAPTPRTFYDDLNAVDHASVPRKLRSAMKKRNHKSTFFHSPKSKKWNHTLGGVESRKKDDIKKRKRKLKRKPTVSGSITKDEEEAVQTLFALAGMFRDDDKDGACSMNPAIQIEDQVEGMTPNSHTQAAADELLSNDNSSNESAKVISSDRTASLEHTDFLESKVKDSGLDCSVPCMSLNHNMPSSSKNNDENPILPGTMCMSREFSIESGLKQSEQQVTPHDRVFAISQEVTAMESQPALRHMIKEPGKNGITLWPGLFSTATVGVGSQNRSQSGAAKLPPWVQTSISRSGQSSSENCSSKMVSEVKIAKKVVKRSVAHVCISHFIQALKKQEGKVNWSLQTIEPNHHEESKGVHLPRANSNRINPDGINITTTASGCGTYTANGNPCEARNSVFPWRPKLHEDQAHFTTFQVLGAKQHFDFLSLSTGGRSLEANTIGKGTGSSSQLQVPYLRPLPEQSILPYSIQQTHYLPSTYVNRISAAASQVQAQLPQCLNTALSGTLHLSHASVSKQEQQLWAMQLSAQHRAARTSATQSQSRNWQLEQQESPAVMSNASSIFSASSRGSVLPKHSSVLQLQQPLMAGSSLLSEMVKKQQHFSPLCEESESRLRPRAALPLRLLCNERL